MSKLSPDAIVDLFKDMTLSEVTEFRKLFETTFDVTADVPATVVAPTVAEEPVEEQTEFDVILESAGEKKVAVIKAVREVVRGLGLKEAKTLVDDAPTVLLRQAPKDDAQKAKAHVEAAGATVTMK